MSTKFLGRHSLGGNALNSKAKFAGLVRYTLRRRTRLTA